MLQTDYVIGSPLNHQDPFIQRHGSQLTADELPPFRQPFTSRRGIRLAYSFPGPARGPKNKTSNAKTKPQKAQSKKPVVSDRQSKGSKDELQLDNKSDILSDESEMEFVDNLDHSHITDTVSWSPVLPPSP